MGYSKVIVIGHGVSTTASVEGAGGGEYRFVSDFISTAAEAARYAARLLAKLAE